ncbi:Uncharacterised protein [Mycobacteroides abscessus subsp. massiliense]|nr:Uncharacterised protein [Mycobacteroides abscessus subsp. massiliense]
MNVSSPARDRSSEPPPASKAAITWAYPMARDAVTPSRNPASSSCSTSATNPCSNIRSVRRAIRSSSFEVSQSNPTIRVSQRGAPMVGADAANGCPVSSITSSARTVRRPSVGKMMAAAAGSRTASSACNAATPISASRCSQRART